MRNPFGSRLLDKVYAPGEIADPGAAAKQLAAWAHSMHLHDDLLAIGHCIRSGVVPSRPIVQARKAVNGAEPMPAASLAVIKCFESHPAAKAQFAVFGRDVMNNGTPVMREAGARILHLLRRRAYANAAALAGARVRYGARGARLRG